MRALADGVEVDEIDAADRRICIVHGTSAAINAYLEVPGELWQHLAQCITRGRPLADYLESQGLDAAVRRRLVSTARQLAASSLLVVGSAARAAT